MIIEERKTLKLPGQTSLFVNLENNFELLPILKQLPLRQYHKELCQWEIPLDQLAYILNSLKLGSEVGLKVLKEKEASSFVIPESMTFRTNPYQYQVEGIQYGLGHMNWLLLDAPGIGKTLQALYLAETLKETEGLKHCLIICGVNSLKWNWLEEIKKHSKYTGYLLGQRFRKNGKMIIGSTQDRADDLLEDIKDFFIITNIETIRDNQVVKNLIKNKNDIQMIVTDEVHKMKGIGTIQGKNFLKLTFPKRKIAMTGTLLLNSPLDAYIPLKWIGAEKSGNYEYRKQYCIYGGYGGFQVVGYKNLNILNNQIKSCSLRRLKSDVLDLPERTFIKAYVEMDRQQKDFYNNLIEGIIDEVDMVEMNQAYEMSVKLRLRQATAWTGILSSEIHTSAKLDRLDDLLEEITSGGHKVLVFSVFKETLNEVSRRIGNKIGHVLCSGDCKDIDINNNIRLFMNDESTKVMLATTAKMGTGFTLTAADYAIFIDLPWNDGLYQQAADRIYRVGQKNAVTIINLITKGTYDEYVQEIVDGKKEMADFVLDDRIAVKSLLQSLKVD